MWANSFVEGGDAGRDAAAGCEFSVNLHPSGADRRDEIVQNAVDDMLVEDADLAVLEQIQLEALELNDFFLGRIADDDAAEVGQPRHGTERGELRLRDGHFHLAPSGVVIGLGNKQASFDLCDGQDGGFLYASR